jgi:hypothetical protein
MSTRSTSPPALLLALSTVVLSWAEPSACLAAEEEWAMFQGNRIGLEADILSTSAKQALPWGSVQTSTLAMPITAVGQIEVFPSFHLDVEIPVVYAKVSSSQNSQASSQNVETSGDHAGFFFGNPAAGFHYAISVLPTLALFGGLGVAIPIVRHADADTLAAAQAALPVRAYFDMHRLLLEHLALRARAGTEILIIGLLHYRGDVTAMLVVPKDTDGKDVVVEQGNELELRLLGGFGVGVRLQEALLPAAEDKLQMAIEPFLGHEPADAGFYLRAGLLIALDEELGFGLDAGKIATLRGAFGLKF